jgi:hypothetical protein
VSCVYSHITTSWLSQNLNSAVLLTMTPWTPVDACSGCRRGDPHLLILINLFDEKVLFISSLLLSK